MRTTKMERVFKIYQYPKVSSISFKAKSYQLISLITDDKRNSLKTLIKSFEEDQICLLLYEIHDITINSYIHIFASMLHYYHYEAPYLA